MSEDKKIQFSLAPRSKPALVVYFTCKNLSGEVRAMVDGKYKAVAKTKNINNELESYYVRIENISAEDINHYYEVRFRGGGEESIIRVSALSYVQKELDPKTTHGRDGMEALTSFYLYYEALLAYLQQ